QVENYPTVDVTSLVAYLSRPDCPTAVMAANDQIAIALYRAAAVSGLRVPDDLSIIGFDNLDLSARLEPGLTTMAQQFNEIGQAAVRLLADRMTNNGPYQHLTLAPQLVVRSSVRTLAAKPALETV